MFLTGGECCSWTLLTAGRSQILSQRLKTENSLKTCLTVNMLYSCSMLDSTRLCYNVIWTIFTSLVQYVIALWYWCFWLQLGFIQNFSTVDLFRLILFNSLLTLFYKTNPSLPVYSCPFVVPFHPEILKESLNVNRSESRLIIRITVYFQKFFSPSQNLIF